MHLTLRPNWKHLTPYVISQYLRYFSKKSNLYAQLGIVSLWGGSLSCRFCLHWVKAVLYAWKFSSQQICFWMLPTSLHEQHLVKTGSLTIRVSEYQRAAILSYQAAWNLVSSEKRIFIKVNRAKSVCFLLWINIQINAS